MIAWNYDATTHVITITGIPCSPGDFVEANSNDPNSAYASGTAVGSTINLTLTGIATSPSGDFFDVYINTNFPTSKTYIDSNVFKIGTSSTTGESLDADWSYDGSVTFGVEFAAPTSDNYQLIVDYVHAGNFVNSAGSSVGGTADTILGVAAGSSIASGTGIRVRLEDVTTFRVIAVRMFTQGSSGTGSPGSPGGPFGGGGGGTSSGMRGTRMPRVPALQRSVARLSVRSRDLQRRYVPIELTSIDGSVTITNPTGPVIDLSVDLPGGFLYGFYDVAVTGIAANGGFGAMTFTYTGVGTALLNLTTPGPTAPGFNYLGIFDFVGRCLSASNVNVRRRIGLEIAGASTPVVHYETSFTGDDVNATVGHLGVSFPFFGQPTDDIQFTAKNYDSVSHDFSITNLLVLYRP